MLPILGEPSAQNCEHTQLFGHQLDDLVGLLAEKWELLHFLVDRHRENGKCISFPEGTLSKGVEHGEMKVERIQFFGNVHGQLGELLAMTSQLDELTAQLLPKK